MIDINKKYRTLKGHEVRIYATDGHGVFSVHGAYWNPEVEGWQTENWAVDGKYSFTIRRDLDLVEVKPRIKQTIYLNIYDDSYSNYVSVRYSKENALDKAEDGLVACVQVDIDVEEGHGL